MPVNFYDKEILYKPKTAAKKSSPKRTTKAAGKKKPAAKGDLKTSTSLSGIELRLLPPFIKDNNTFRLPLFPGFAKLYCVVIVVSDVNNQLAGGIDLQGFPRIGDKEHLPINKSIFFWQKLDGSSAPSQVHIMCSVVKSKSGLRDVGAILSELKEDKSYKTITEKLAGLAKNATAAGSVVTVITELTAIVGKYLKNVEDKPLGTFIQSYTSLNGDFDGIGAKTLDYPTKKVDFQISLIVRDQARATAAIKRGAKKTVTAAAIDNEPVVVDIQPF